MAQASGSEAESRQPRGERRRRRLLEAALRVMAERGAGGLTFRALAEEAGVSLGVTTYYFPSRRELLAAAFRHHLEDVRERGESFEARAGAARQAGDLSDPALADAILEFLEALARDDRASVIAGHELSLAMTRDAALTREVDAASDAHHRSTAALVGRAAGDEAPEEDAAILSAVFDALLLGLAARPDDPAYRERARRIVGRVVEKLF